MHSPVLVCIFLTAITKRHISTNASQKLFSLEHSSNALRQPCAYTWALASAVNARSLTTRLCSSRCSLTLNIGNCVNSLRSIGSLINACLYQPATIAWPERHTEKDMAGEAIIQLMLFLHWAFLQDAAISDSGTLKSPHLGEPGPPLQESQGPCSSSGQQIYYTSQSEAQRWFAWAGKFG